MKKSWFGLCIQICDCIHMVPCCQSLQLTDSPRASAYQRAAVTRQSAIYPASRSVQPCARGAGCRTGDKHLPFPSHSHKWRRTHCCVRSTCNLAALPSGLLRCTSVYFGRSTCFTDINTMSRLNTSANNSSILYEILLRIEETAHSIHKRDM